MRSTRFNPYRTFANDGKALSQWTEVPKVECVGCHQSFNTTRDIVYHETGLCEDCTKKASTEKKS